MAWISYGDAWVVVYSRAVVVLLAGGKLIKKGTPLDVLNSDEFARAFHMGGDAE